MKQIYGIGFLLLILVINCLAIPTDLQNFINIETKPKTTMATSDNIKPEAKLQIEKDGETYQVATKAHDTKFEKETQLDTKESFRNKEDLEPLKKSLEILTEKEVKTPLDVIEESTRNVKVLDDPKCPETLTDLKAKEEKMEYNIIKDSPKDSPMDKEKIHELLEVWRDSVNDFSLLEERLPDLTEEEYNEINKEGAIPWNFLKNFGVNKNVNDVRPNSMQTITPIYITVPIVINTRSNLPISLSIGGQNIPLKTDNEIKESNVRATAPVKQTTSNTLIIPTSIFNKLMDYTEAPPPSRQSNRHRSNFHKKLSAYNNNNEI